MKQRAGLGYRWTFYQARLHRGIKPRRAWYVSDAGGTIRRPRRTFERGDAMRLTAKWDADRRRVDLDYGHPGRCVPEVRPEMSSRIIRKTSGLSGCSSTADSSTLGGHHYADFHRWEQSETDRDPSVTLEGDDGRRSTN